MVSVLGRDAGAGIGGTRRRRGPLGRRAGGMATPNCSISEPRGTEGQRVVQFRNSRATKSRGSERGRAPGSLGRSQPWTHSCLDANYGHESWACPAQPWRHRVKPARCVSWHVESVLTTVRRRSHWVTGGSPCHGTRTDRTEHSCSHRPGAAAETHSPPGSHVHSQGPGRPAPAA